MTDDLFADDAMKRQLRGAASDPPYDDVDWSALHARVTAAAAPIIRRRSAAWWQQLAGWSPRAVPAAASAAVALVALLLVVVVRPAPPVADGTADFVLVEEVLAEAMAATMPLLVPGGDDAIDALLLNPVEP